MRVLFISVPCVPESSGVLISHSPAGPKLDILPDYPLYLLAAGIKKHRFLSDVLDLTFTDYFHLEDSLERIPEYDAEVFYLHVHTPQWPVTRTVIHALKRNYEEIPVIIGGKLPTLLDEHILSTTPVDYIIRQEGERVLPQLLRYLNGKKENLEKIAGVSYKKDGVPVRNEDAKLLDDQEYESLPFALLERIPEGVYDAASLETSRGNPFYSPFSTLRSRKEWRSLSPMRIYEHLYWIRENVSDRVRHEYVVLTDDYFTAKEKRIIDFRNLCEKKGLMIPLEYSTRCSDLIEKSLVDCLAPMTRKVVVPIHAGYNKGLAMLRSGFTLKTIRDAAATLGEYGLAEKSEFVFTICFPWEDFEEASKTIEFAGSLFEEYGVSVRIQRFIPKIDSIYWHDLFRQGKILPEWYDSSCGKNPGDPVNYASPGCQRKDFEKLDQLIRKYSKDTE